MSRKPDLQIPTPRLPPEKAERILLELDRVLSSPQFKGSRRCHSLLRRIVEQSVVGEVDSLKERALGVDVFGRPPDYDTSEDPVVRASAAETRKKLAQYYQQGGHDSVTRIELPPGSYLAEFQIEAAKPPTPAVLPQSNPRTWRKWWVWAGTACMVAVAVAALASRWRDTELDVFWAPVLKAPGTVLLCIGLQAAYNLKSAQLQDEVQGIIPPTSGVTEGAHPLAEKDLILLRDRYVALDDALCLVRLTSMLERHGRAYRIRAERSTSFADLRDTPAVLIGAFDNPWTLRTADQLRFTFRKDSEHDIGMVHDSQHPENRQWTLSQYWPNWDVPVDYAIVTRMVDTTTDRPVIIAAGLTQYGTIGAGEFISNAQYFAEAAQHLPKGWQRRSLQIVLSVPVVNRISGRARVLATHVW